MSAGGDLCAYVRVAGTIKEGVDVRAHFWIPQDTAIRRQREEGMPYLEYAQMGLVTLIPGDVIDPLVIRDYILEDARRLGGRLRRIHSDFYNSREVGEALIKAGLDFVWFKTTALSVHPPIKAVEGLVARRKIRHDGHPLLTYCMGNAVVRETSAQLKYLVKPTNLDRIDGAAALVAGVAGLMDLTGYDGEGGEEARKSDIKDFRIIPLKW
jgi:phage terminase large subunit-like protein